MQEKEVIQLIQSVVKPLREKIEFLEKENQKLKSQINVVFRPLHYVQGSHRQRSKSKQDLIASNKEEPRIAKQPSVKKREEKIEKPSWNIGKASKPDMRSPPSKDRHAMVPHPPRPAGLPTSKEKREPQVTDAESGKKITGGKKIDLVVDQAKNGLISPESQQTRRSNRNEQLKE